MIIKLYRSATVGIDFGSFKVLTDPWLTDGEYYGSWSHYPPFEIEKYLDKKTLYNVNLKSDIYISLDKKYLKLPKNGKKLQLANKTDIDPDSNYVIYKTDLRLRKLLLKGPRYAHWNNAEIGSHIKFIRNPDVWESALYQSMSYFHN